jgi:ribosome-associated heat shock protein Hsp15
VRQEVTDRVAFLDVRLDVWLDVACLFPTRSKAAAACAGGKVDLNGRAASAHKAVRPGDALAITLPSGKRTFRVVAVIEKRVRKAEARALYEETTPPLSPAELEARRLERLLAPRDSGTRPSKRDRRLREKLKRL